MNKVDPLSPSLEVESKPAGQEIPYTLWDLFIICVHHTWPEPNWSIHILILHFNMHFNTILPCKLHIQGVHRENQLRHEGDHSPLIAAWNSNSARPYTFMSRMCIILPLLSFYTYISPVVLSFQVA